MNRRYRPRPGQRRECSRWAARVDEQLVLLQVQDLANMLSCMGACILGAGTDRIHVQPPEQLDGCDYTIMPDRIEAGTFMAAAAVTGSRLAIEPVIPSHLHMVTQALQAAGCSVAMSPMPHCARCGPKRLGIVELLRCTPG